MEVPQTKSTMQQVNVVAPCAMQEGFTFMADYGDATFPVVVPPGGAKKGQTLSVPFPVNGDFRSEVSPFILNGGNGAEPQRHQGGWKDDLWDCFRFGPCHATVWNALCCPQLLMAQVLTRMKMNWLGEEAPAHEYKRTFGRVFLIVCLYWLLTTLSWPPSSTFIQDPESGKVMRIPPDEVPAAQNLLFNLVLQSFGLYTLLMIIKLRRTVRLRYEIPLQYPLFGNGKMEDFCLAFWCGCCSLSQMARHTCDYEQQSATFCSPDGLKRSQHSPVLVV